MAYANLTPNLQDMFNQINDRLRKLESGPNSAAYAAASAQSTAYTSAVDAAAAQALAASAVQVSANTIVNATNQLTALNSSGITVYSGASATSGARVLMNSLGLVGYNSSGTPTFSLSSSDGSLALTGSIISGGSISGATVTATAGTVGGWTLNASYLTDGSTTYLKPLSTSTQFSILTGAGISASSVTVGTGVVPIINGGTGYSFSVGGTSFFTGAVSTSGQMTVGGNLQVQSMSSTSATGVVWSSSNSRFYLTTSTERHKDNITPIPAADYLSKLLELQPVTFNYKPEFTDNPNQLISGLIAEKVAAIPEFSTVVNLDAEGQPESLAYDRLAVFILPALKQLNDRLTALEAK